MSRRGSCERGLSGSNGDDDGFADARVTRGETKDPVSGSIGRCRSWRLPPLLSVGLRASSMPAPSAIRSSAAGRHAHLRDHLPPHSHPVPPSTSPSRPRSLQLEMQRQPRQTITSLPPPPDRHSVLQPVRAVARSSLRLGLIRLEMIGGTGVGTIVQQARRCPSLRPLSLCPMTMVRGQPMPSAWAAALWRRRPWTGQRAAGLVTRARSLEWDCRHREASRSTPARPPRLRERQQSLGLSGPSCRPGLGLCNAMSESACGGAIAHSEEAEEAGGDGWEVGGRAVARGASSFGLEGLDLEGWPSTCYKTGARTLDLGLLW